MTNNLTLFSEKLKHVSIFDPCRTLKVSGDHLGNATICGISENIAYGFIKLSAKSHSFNILCTIDVRSCPTILNISWHVSVKKVLRHLWDCVGNRKVIVCAKIALHELDFFSLFFIRKFHIELCHSRPTTYLQHLKKLQFLYMISINYILTSK